jgi:hypothetical protein
MRLNDGWRSQRPCTATGAAILATPTFLALLIALLIAAASMSGAGPPRAGSGAPPPREGTKDAAPVADPDLEAPVVEVARRGAGIVYRLGSREAGSAAELQRLLEPLARLGGPISVRIAHDLPFARSWEAIEACRGAGFASVLLVPRPAGS